MKTTTLALPAALLTMSLVSCDNPADKTADASAKEAVVKTADTAAGKKYVFAPESKIGFTGSKVTGSREGGFKSFTGHFSIQDGAPVGNDHKVVIDMNSTFSDDERLTSHLKAPDFFDVKRFPETTFDVTAFKNDSGTNHTISGNFKLHGVEKNISFPVIVSQDGGTVKIAATFDIKRKDFGIVYTGRAEDLIRDEVVIHLDLVAKPEA